MKNYQDETYGDQISDVYDDWYGSFDPQVIETLGELAGTGRALELGIGTGRIALPLLEKGVRVHGIDASQAMVAKLREKPGGGSIPVTIGNFADVAVEGKFDLVYVVFNTFFALLTQEDQVRCFLNVRRHLAPEGKFVVEAFVPDMNRFTGGQSLRTVELEQGKARLDATQIDMLTQQISSQHILLDQQGVHLYPVKLRFVWVSEMDLMARLAGLRLNQRWESWSKSPFRSESSKHISVYALSE